ncbi:hypothetical protein CH35J_008717 [Colletotrichum higginsianum]|uniref:Uncharacterized protein n=1 Tax=Colletotrichum higginsianum TaxID=80884 RepID=A0A4V6TT93_9PEZI|nr:hypothetical protein CH35J_008717 [Colletotrichum higginsianum]
MMGRQRSRSDDVASTSPKVRRFSNALRKISTMTSVKDDKPLKPGDDVGFGFGESSDAVSSRDSSSAIAFNDSDFNLRQLQQLTQRVRSTLASKDADAAFKNYAKARDHATLCQSLFDISILAPAVNGQANRASPEGRGVSHEVSLDVPHSPTTIDSRSSLSGRSLSEVTTGQSCGQRSGPSHKTCLSAVRDWKKCIESLLEALKLTLSETYKSYEPYATPRMVESLFHNKEFRAAAIQQMRKTSIDKTFSASPDFFPRYIIRLRNYDRVRQDLVDITRILQLAESGVSDERLVKEYHVSPRGDAILEFANIGAEPLPVLRFRVSSFLLAETSPIFERMFAKHTHIEIHDDEDVTDQLAPPPSPYICDDGTEAKLYRMPQQESDSEHALTILLHAAHMHNDKVPREVSFEQLVAIADVCLRYRCTSPLELFVEHRWLPQWIHKSSEDMPDGMLLISYAFGLRQLFTRMSKTIILNLVDEEELKNKPWPQKMKDRILAPAAASQEPLTQPESFSYRGIAPHTAVDIQQQTKVSQREPLQTPRRSLAQLVDLLRTIASPPQALHRGGVCDPTPQFRTAISDIYNSVSGLTLYDISKRSHGWGLSRHRSGQPQAILQKGLKNPGKKEQGAKVDLTDTIRLRILQSADNVDDLHTTAMINRGFYQTFHKNQLSLMWKFVKPIRRMTLMRRTPTGAFGFDEDKVPKEEADALKADVKAAREADGGLDGPGEDERPEGSETQAAQGIAATGALLSACLPEGAPASDAPSLLVFSDEEAQQILWPVKPLSPPHDAPCQSSAAEIAAKAVTKREKSWVSDPAFVEEKMLLKGEDKHLREERDRRVGLVRDGEH